MNKETSRPNYSGGEELDLEPYAKTEEITATYASMNEEVSARTEADTQLAVDIGNCSRHSNILMGNIFTC